MAAGESTGDAIEPAENAGDADVATSEAAQPTARRSRAVTTAGERPESLAAPGASVQYGPMGTGGPFNAKQLDRIDEALTMASWESGVDFSVYVGELGDDPKTRAESLHAELGDRAGNSCLLAVSPGERVLQIVTGEQSVRRLPDRSCALAVMSMTASFGGGDVVGGIVNGLRMLSDQAGRLHNV